MSKSETRGHNATENPLQIPVEYHLVPGTTCNRPNCEGSRRNWNYFRHSYIIPVFILVVLVLLVLFLPWEAFDRSGDPSQPVATSSPCQIQLVETLPVNLRYPPESPMFLSTFDAWQLLLDRARFSVDIVSPYWGLRNVDTDAQNGFINKSSAWQGEKIFQRLLSNADMGSPQLRLRIVLHKSQESVLHADANILANYGAAEVVTIALQNSGLLNTNLWIVDEEHFYLGSARMDWKALYENKELGILAQNCAVLTHDLSKIFKAYWKLGFYKVAIPSNWPWVYRTNYNLVQPLLIKNKNNNTMQAYISSSPPKLSAAGRTQDLDAILNVIATAKDFIKISIMDYYPLVYNGTNAIFWPYIDNALRKAAIERRVKIRMLISWNEHSDPNIENYLRSLEDLSASSKNIDIQIRRFVVATRVAFMVTEKIVYMSTNSNWKGEFFLYSAGVGLVLANTKLSNNTLRNNILNIFERDWHSSYALSLNHIQKF